MAKRRWKYCWFMSYSFVEKSGSSGIGYGVIENDSNLNETKGLKDTIDFLKEREHAKSIVPIFFRKIKPLTNRT
jgi:hypothetical protein